MHKKASQSRSDGSVGRLDLELKRRGRRPPVMLSPEHAAVVRRAVKTATRYYGIKISDLADGSRWVTTAMRSSTPLSLDVAVRLYRLVQVPPAHLTGKKPPQGPSLAEIAPTVLRFRDDPIANPIPDNATSAYLDSIFEAAAILNLYVTPFPGSAIFVVPGIASSLAQSLVDSFMQEITRAQMTKAAREKLVLFLEHAFKTAERPLYTEYGRQLLPHLMRLGVANRREFTRLISEQFPDQISDDFETRLSAHVDAEERRLSALQKEPKKRARRKRRLTMPRIRDSLK